MHSDSKQKARLFAAGDLRRYAFKNYPLTESGSGGFMQERLLLGCSGK
jgi:hypothetical protein